MRVIRNSQAVNRRVSGDEMGMVSPDFRGAAFGLSSLPMPQASSASMLGINV